MKKILFLLLVLCTVQGVHAQKSVDKLIDQLKKDKSAYALTLPGWLIRTGINIADEDELRFEPGFQELVGGIKRLRVLHLDRNSMIPNGKFAGLIDQIIEDDGYEEYARVKSEDANVHVIVKEYKDKVKGLVVLANSDDGLTILNLRTNIDMDDLRKANLSFNKNKRSDNHEAHEGHDH